MKKYAGIFVLVAALISATSLAQSSRRQTTKPVNKAGAPAVSAPAAMSVQEFDRRLAKARQLAAAGQYQEASKLLFYLSRQPQFAKESSQVKYILGLMFYEMRLNQAAAFVFYDVVHQESHAPTKSKYLHQSLEKLAMAADTLNSDVILTFAIKQIREDEFPAANRDMLAFRTGEIKMGEKDFNGATHEFARVQLGSTFYSRALYQMGLAYAEMNQTDRAMAAFDQLFRRSGGGETDTNRVDALLGKARVLYQKKDFEGAIEAYRQIPRDTEQWHEALFESSWAMLRDGRLRSALSNFHSLHSPYYEDFYQPESLFLRAIVYLYICRYEEMDKVLNLFERVYKPVQNDVHNMLSAGEPQAYFHEIVRVYEKYDAIRTGRAPKTGFRIPFIVAREILKEGDVRRTFSYLNNLNQERRRIDVMPGAWRSSSVGQYAKKIVEKRIEATQILAGKQVKRHLLLIQDELKDLFEQTGFLRFEMLASKKETLRKEIQGKDLASHVDDSQARDYYIQNGYDYWPFRGEYWLDEIGNYHYVGVRACE